MKKKPTHTRLQLCIREAAERRGITSAYQLQSRLHFFPSVAAHLWRDAEVQEIRFQTLEKVIDGLSRFPEDKPLKCRLKEIIREIEISEEEARAREKAVQVANHQRKLSRKKLDKSQKTVEKPNENRTELWHETASPEKL